MAESVSRFCTGTRRRPDCNSRTSPFLQLWVPAVFGGRDYGGYVSLTSKSAFLAAHSVHRNNRVRRFRVIGRLGPAGNGSGPARPHVRAS